MGLSQIQMVTTEVSGLQDLRVMTSQSCPGHNVQFTQQISADQRLLVTIGSDWPHIYHAPVK